MKLIHTADWHLGQTFHGQERHVEQRAFLDWLLTTLDTRRPDALLNRAIRDGQEVARHTDLVSLSLALQAAVLDLLHASHCHCLFYDPDTQTLISLGADGKESHRETATVGLASFVVRTGQSVLVDEVGREPRYDPDADTPEGDADMRFLGTPLVGPDGAPLGVVTALRPAAQPAFDETSKRVLEAFASQLGPVVSVRLDRWLRQSRGELMETETPEFSSHLFRKPAVEAFRQGERGEGDVLRLSPFWMTLTYRLLIGVLPDAYCGTYCANHCAMHIPPFVLFVAFVIALHHSSC